MSRLLSEYDSIGKVGYRLPPCDVPSAPSLPDSVKRRTIINLPTLSEFEVVRHFTNLASKTFSVDQGMYPLGSCTMKYNPKVNEEIAKNPHFNDIHPLQDVSTIQGSLEVMDSLLKRLCSIVGMDDGTLQSAGGAQGEYIGLHIIKSYHKSRGDLDRNTVLIPSNAHGTNPASAAFCNMDVKEIPVSTEGLVDPKTLASLLDESVAAIMLTNPNTLGLYEDRIKEIATIAHTHGALLYYDGANLNAIMNIVKPGAMGFDVMHVNVHKTFSTPHGGGGPGAGPVLVKSFLSQFLPVPRITYDGHQFCHFFGAKESIGKTLGFWGNFLVLLRSFAYITQLGDDGLIYSSQMAVLNANYIKSRIKKYLPLSHEGNHLHEIVVSVRQLKEASGTTAFDIAKALIDKGYHPPTIYFPLIVPEAMMIEPTESESLEDLDTFIDTLIDIIQEALENESAFKHSPIHTCVKRVDEVNAARNPVVHW